MEDSAQFVAPKVTRKFTLAAAGQLSILHFSFCPLALSFYLTFPPANASSWQRPRNCCLPGPAFPASSTTAT